MAKKQKTNSNLLEVQNAAKTMFANIRFQSIDKPLKSLLLTSSVPDEGKTTTAWYLAQAAATAGNMVLLVEADMRRRSMANMLRLHPQNGLFAVLTGTSRLKDAVIPTSVENLFFLDAEPGIPNPPDVLASKRMRMLNEDLCTEYDYVIYDTPPVGTFVDAAVLSTVVDGVVLVVRPGRPRRTELQLAFDQLDNAGANIIGLCTTFVEGTGSEYYYSYYTKGERRKRGAAVEEPYADAGDRGSRDFEIITDSTAGASHGFEEPAFQPVDTSSDAKWGNASKTYAADADNAASNRAPAASASSSADTSGSKSAKSTAAGSSASTAKPASAQNDSQSAYEAYQPAQKQQKRNKKQQGTVSVTRNKNSSRNGGISVPRGNPTRGQAGRSGIVKKPSSGRTGRSSRR